MIDCTTTEVPFDKQLGLIPRFALWIRKYIAAWFRNNPYWTWGMIRHKGFRGTVKNGCCETGGGFAGTHGSGCVSGFLSVSCWEEKPDMWPLETPARQRDFSSPRSIYIPTNIEMNGPWCALSSSQNKLGGSEETNKINSKNLKRGIFFCFVI